MGQSNEHEVVELLRKAPHFDYPTDAEEGTLNVLRSVQGTHKRFRNHNKQFSWLFQVGAGVAALAILGAGLWVYQGQTINHQAQLNRLASSKAPQTQDVTSGGVNAGSKVLHPSSVSSIPLLGAAPSTTYTYTGSEAIPAIKQYVTFKVKQPTVPVGFPPYQVQVTNTVYKSGKQSPQQFVAFVSLTVPGEQAQFKGKSEMEILGTHKWQQYSVSDYPQRNADKYFTSVPYLKTVSFDGTGVKVYTDKYHGVNEYVFDVDNHLVLVRFDAGNYKLGVDPLTDKNAWAIIQSLIKGKAYLN
ncbi:hypothetical protein LLE49_28100 [Alicyclobacillus tolerans]|uniref:hypothetical protein n=1 Tax=Alicyclobacillus tolerans TaxID=90970 RepID=UPI001F29776C|nr:hypothetical protein [Alicyclobacillus tolerans]MCF8568586.1 hypothetical protein [Alicyclobacillus tolerans]